MFNTVEINSTFKRIPRVSTFDKWCHEVPPHFQFTLKLLKDFTHVKKLAIELNDLAAFMNAANHISAKKGCLLVQFPASITSEFRKQVHQLLEALHQLDAGNQWQKAIEFRSVTWYTDETSELLLRYKACLVLHDMPKSNNLHIESAYPFFYFRYHGPKGDYKCSYTDAFLQEQAEKMYRLLAEGNDVYAYFNNTMGSAYENAIRLKQLLEKAL